MATRDCRLGAEDHQLDEQKERHGVCTFEGAHSRRPSMRSTLLAWPLTWVV